MKGISIASMAAVLILGGCELAEEQQNATIDPANARAVPISVENYEWLTIENNDEDPTNRFIAGSFREFLRSTERISQERRRIGIKFWNTHADDTRRYQWLIDTVHLPPRYPIDIEKWLDAEVLPYVNTNLVDEERHREWDARYAKMKEEFLSSKRVNEHQRRYLLVGELLNRLLNAPHDRATGRSIDGSQLLADIVSFAEQYPEPFDPADDLIHHATIADMWALPHVFFEEIGFSKAELETFSNNLVAISESVRDSVRSRQRSEYMQILADAIDSEKVDGLQWIKLTYGRHRWYPERNGGTPAFATIHQRIVGFRRELEYGRYLFDNEGSSMLAERWFDRVIRHYPVAEVFTVNASTRARYLLSYWGGENHSSEPSDPLGSPAGSGSDLVAIREWRSWRETNQTEDFDEIELLAYDFAEASIECLSEEQNSRVLLLLDKVDLFRRNGVPRSEELIAFLARGFVEGKRTYCLSPDDSFAYLEAWSKLGIDSVDTILIGLENIIALRTEPFLFRGVDINGIDFDMESLRGKVALIQFWDVNCSACIAAIPLIQNLQDRIGTDNFAVASINFDSLDRERYVRRIVSEYDVEWPVIMASDRFETLSDRFGWGRSLPQYFLLRADGTLGAHTPAIRVSDKSLAIQIQALLDHRALD